MDSFVPSMNTYVVSDQTTSDCRRRIISRRAVVMNPQVVPKWVDFPRDKSLALEDFSPGHDGAPRSSLALALGT